MSSVDTYIYEDELHINLEQAIAVFPCVEGIEYKLSAAAVKELSVASIADPDTDRDSDEEDKVPAFAEPARTMIKDGKVNCSLYNASNEYIGYYPVSTEDLIYDKDNQS